MTKSINIPFGRLQRRSSRGANTGSVRLLRVLVATVVVIHFSFLPTFPLAFGPVSKCKTSSLSNMKYYVPRITTLSSSTFLSMVGLSPEEQALERTKTQLLKLTRNNNTPRKRPLATTTTTESIMNINDNHNSNDDNTNDLLSFEDRVQEYLRYSGNKLKELLQAKGLPTKGRKPDLAKRLVELEWQLQYGRSGPTTTTSTTKSDSFITQGKDDKLDTPALSSSIPLNRNHHFCGLSLSSTARLALTNAQFLSPTPIQEQAIPVIAKGESVILHAATGSGKTLAYLLPITEYIIWQQEPQQNNGATQQPHYAIILTPTRELAAQVAGVASSLLPPGMVRLVTHATNLMSDMQYLKERRGRGVVDHPSDHPPPTSSSSRNVVSPRIFVGSAKAIMHSLYGDGKMPASPTRKPAAQQLLSSTRWIVLDEVDRLLLGSSSSSSNHHNHKNTGSSSNNNNNNHKKRRDHQKPFHEKPAAIVTSAVARRTLGQAQVIGVSATIGRTLKRELSRVLGVPPKEFPRVIVGRKCCPPPQQQQYNPNNDDDNENDIDPTLLRPPQKQQQQGSGHVVRAVTIPETVRHYVIAVDTSSVGKLLTNAFDVLKALNSGEQKGRQRKRRILLVLTKGCGITTQHTIGALKHFGCQPEPISLLDALEGADGTDQLMEVYRQVSGSIGVGQASTTSLSSSFVEQEPKQQQQPPSPDNDKSGIATSSDDQPGYLLVTGEDSIRGLHLDGLDTVVVVGRPQGPDEYTHIAGRTGRAGQSGTVINVLSQQHAIAVRGWEKMLDIQFHVLDNIDVIQTIGLDYDVNNKSIVE